ncbi:MAG: hypothetical protein ABIT76_04080 [Chthoniobacterales bacterium]
MNKFTTLAVTLALGSSSLLTSCESAAGTGALVGAGIGGIIGHNTNNGGGTRTAVGAGLGALAGALAGAAYDEHKREKYAREDGYYRDGEVRGYERRERSYPYGEPTRYAGYVRSPYRPYNIIDVRGIPSGALVVDPSVDRPFRNP